MTDALTALQLELTKALCDVGRKPEAWADLAGITRAYRQVEREHAGAGIAADSRSIMATVNIFRRTGSAYGVRDLKYICLGVGIRDERGWCVLSDPDLRHRLAELIGQLPNWRRRIRCFQALLSSYWAFPVHSDSVSEQARDGWKELRVWLRSERGIIARTKEPKPSWFEALTRHIELLSDQPCKNFGQALLQGDSAEFNHALESLAIPRDSWVMADAVFAQMKAATALADDSFNESLTKLVPMAIGRSGVEVGNALRIRCVALLVSRYARCDERREHTALRDAAVSVVGNPWLNRTKWDAWVLDRRGQPDNQAREMVNGWLKRRLISDFFLLLSADGTGDRRRLDYWLRFEPYIEDMWFALGRDTQLRKGEEFNEFTKLAKGRLLQLEESTSDNNAFVMRIGQYLAVEFGATGYFRLFKWTDLGADFIDTLTSTYGRPRISHKYLRLLVYEERMKHIDSATRTWESKFDERLCPLFGVEPVDPARGIGTARARTARGPTPTEWLDFVGTFHLTIEDRRSYGGALWVLGHDLPLGIVRKLKAWGFQERVPRGWFKEYK